MQMITQKIVLNTFFSVVIINGLLSLLNLIEWFQIVNMQIPNEGSFYYHWSYVALLVFGVVCPFIIFFGVFKGRRVCIYLYTWIISFWYAYIFFWMYLAPSPTLYIGGYVDACKFVVLILIPLIGWMCFSGCWVFKNNGNRVKLCNLVIATALTSALILGLFWLTKGDIQNATHYYEIGSAKYLDGEYQTALDYYSKAIDLLPDYQDAIYWSSKCVELLDQQPK